MINKKGFTLVELLAVIGILGIIMIIAVPASLSTSTKVKEKMLKTKIDLIDKSAVLWAQDNRRCFSTGCNNCSGNVCTVTLKFLADENYLDYDEDQKIINPVDKSDISLKTVTITYNSNGTFSSKCELES